MCKGKNSLKTLHSRKLDISDIPMITLVFSKANWPKSTLIFENYYQEQLCGKRLIWLAYLNNEFAGYVTLKWESQYMICAYGL